MRPLEAPTQQLSSCPGRPPGLPGPDTLGVRTTTRHRRVDRKHTYSSQRPSAERPARNKCTKKLVKSLYIACCVEVSSALLRGGGSSPGVWPDSPVFNRRERGERRDSCLRDLCALCGKRCGLEPEDEVQRQPEILNVARAGDRELRGDTELTLLRELVAEAGRDAHEVTLRGRG